MRLMCAFLLLLAPALSALSTDADVVVTINTGVRHQTILGWGASSWCPPWATQRLRNEIVKEAVDDLGLTRLRLEPPSGNRSNTRRWEWLNDNGDPYNIDWSDFNTTALDGRLQEIVIPFKRRVEANGNPFEVYLSPSYFDGGSSGRVPAWLFYSPGEYAEHAIALITYLKDNYDITADYYCILNEAGNNNPFSAAVVGRMIGTLGPWLGALGLPTKIQFPECVNGNASWNYIQTLQNDSLIWPYIGLVTYHLYGANDPYRTYIRDFAVTRGLPTGQTEYMWLTMEHMYDDLTLGGVSYWELYGQGQWIRPNYDKTSFRRSSQYWNFRQVLHYVRPGDVRVEATSDDPALRPLAFVRNGKTVVVLLNNTPPQQARTVNITGIPAGAYGVCQSAGGGVYRELGIHNPGVSGTLSVDVAQNAVMTIYPHPGRNARPTVTDWRASPSYLTLPSNSTTLSASATDPETDPISYGWSVTAQPIGARVLLSTPDSASTFAAGLTVAGQYVFTVLVSDGIHAAPRDVVLNVHAGNERPGVDDVHNRMPVMITLPTDTTLLRGWAWDLGGDPLTYQWSVISQPSGADVTLINASTTNCTARDMTVAGDYVFEFKARDPTHVVSETLTVPVYPINAAPVVDSAGANPDSLMLPEDSTLLWAATTDPDGDTVTHWWSLKTAPAGASPVFDKQGRARTMVRGLTPPGTFAFTLTVVDMSKHTTKGVTVDVTVGVAEDVNRSLPGKFALFQNTPNPFSGGTIIGFSIPAKSRIEISVYNVQGQLIRTLVEGVRRGGIHTVSWDGRDGKGRKLASGVYFCRLEVLGDTWKIRKMLLVR